MTYSDKQHLVIGSSVSALYQKELYRNLDVVGIGTKNKKYVFSATNFPKIELDLDFLVGASEAYAISPNPEDYVLVPLPIVTADIPNRNLQGFPLEEVGRFDAAYGQYVYQTFKGKGTYTDHRNDDPLGAKGIHVDSSMQYVPKYDLWKICVMTLWDRSKDQKLVADIESGKRNGYSMGAMVNAFHCSICGQIDNMDHRSCEHMQSKGSLWGQERRLSWQACIGVAFFETSSVGEPADITAISDDVYV